MPRSTWRRSGKIVGTVNLPSYTTLAIYDRSGTVLARFPETALSISKSVGEAEIFKMTRALGEGVAEATGSDGKQWLYGFTAVGDTFTNQIFLHIGIPTEVAWADAEWLLKRNLAALLLVTALALIAAWYGGDIFVLRHLRAFGKHHGAARFR